MTDNTKLTYSEVVTLGQLAERALVRPQTKPKLDAFKRELLARGVSPAAIKEALSGKML